MGGADGKAMAVIKVPTNFQIQQASPVLLNPNGKPIQFKKIRSEETIECEAEPKELGNVEELKVEEEKPSKLAEDPSSEESVVVNLGSKEEEKVESNGTIVTADNEAPSDENSASSEELHENYSEINKLTASVEKERKTCENLVDSKNYSDENKDEILDDKKNTDGDFDSLSSPNKIDSSKFDNKFCENYEENLIKEFNKVFDEFSTIADAMEKEFLESKSNPVIIRK